ncbi:MAG: hypothetical protein CBC22_03810 [Alphaproteobacteria bacterium TMED62]|nr:MAG: hypothetical protein CBC22_03810 [Alphaproteobacteria bacterium TMED62]|tara:strand:- start:694 stop:1437 length:744 start_codon:yes stop_codon:yes gene_type:complete
MKYSKHKIIAIKAIHILLIVILSIIIFIKINEMKNIFLFIVPARGGSKRLPGKNLKNFMGKPLIFWTLEQALRLKKYGNTVVSSDSDLILKKCSKYKDLIILKRPKYLSTNYASLIDVTKHVTNKLKHENNILILQPTSPLRKDNDIIKGIKIIEKGASAVMSQSKLQYNLKKIGLSNAKNYFKPLGIKNSSIYAPNGAVFAAKYEWILKHKTFYDKSVKTYEMPSERAIDIDYKHQLKLAELFLKK